MEWRALPSRLYLTVSLPSLYRKLISEGKVSKTGDSGSGLPSKTLRKEWRGPLCGLMHLTISLPFLDRNLVWGRETARGANGARHFGTTLSNVGFASSSLPCDPYAFQSWTCSCCSSAGISLRGTVNWSGPVACSIWRWRFRAADISCGVLSVERSRFSNSL